MYDTSRVTHLFVADFRIMNKIHLHFYASVGPVRPNLQDAGIHKCKK